MLLADLVMDYDVNLKSISIVFLVSMGYSA